MEDIGDLVNPKRLRTMQIIAGAILMGLLAFVAVSLYVILIANDGKAMVAVQGLALQSVMAVFMFVACFALAQVVPNVQTRTALKRVADGTWKMPAGGDRQESTSVPAQLMVVRQTGMIVGLALVEAPGFMGCLAYVLEGQEWVLAVPGLVALWMLATFPTRQRVQSWVERQVAALEEMRRQAPTQG